VSAVIVTLASAEMIKDSFLQEKRLSTKDIISIPRVFIELKNNVSIPQSHKGHKGIFLILLVFAGNKQEISI
jgi:hypothetical protein